MEQKKYDVFISYSRKDYVDEHKNVIPDNEVSKIKGALTKAGITFWFDEEGVYSGNEFAKVIIRSIKASRIFLFLSTENSNLSDWTASEIASAHMMKKIIIPVRLDDSDYNDDVILYLSRLSHIDYGDNPEKGRQELIRSINAYLEEDKRKLKKKEEEKKRLERIAALEAKMASDEIRRAELRKTVSMIEQELKSAQVDLRECETQIQETQTELKELKHLPETVPVPDSPKGQFVAREKEDGRVLEIMFNDQVKFNMIRVEGGKFKMGATPDQGLDVYEDEKPAHDVTVASFYIGEAEVTQELWQFVMDSNPSFFKGDHLPVEQISWENCQEFIKALNDKTGFAFRLPTEAEWEYAARGGRKSKACMFSGSHYLDEVAWYEMNSNGKTHPVKEKKPNELGLYDMCGNVLEWCNDLYASYKSSPQNDIKKAAGDNHVLRGGSWNYVARCCRVAYRGNYCSDSRNIGFRLALVYSKAKDKE